MRKILTLLLIMLLGSSPALAFFWKKKKKEEKASKVAINEEILIHGKYKGSHGDSVLSKILELRLAVHIPRDKNYLTITTLYDEASENPIEEITWIREAKKGRAANTRPYKTEAIINKRLEELSINYNPSLAYDRIHDNKHVVNKVFYFKQSDAIGDRDKQIAHFLDLYMPGDHGPQHKRIRIDDRLYPQKPEVAFIPEPPKKKKNKKKSRKELEEEEQQALAELKRRQEQQARLEAEQQQDMADLQYAIDQLNGNNNAYGDTGINPEQLRQIQLQQQVDAFGPASSPDGFSEDLY